MNLGGVSGIVVLSGEEDIVDKNLKDLNCNNGTGKTKMCTGSGCYRRTSFMYKYNSNNTYLQFQII